MNFIWADTCFLRIRWTQFTDILFRNFALLFKATWPVVLFLSLSVVNFQCYTHFRQRIWKLSFVLCPAQSNSTEKPAFKIWQNASVRSTGLKSFETMTLG